MSNERMTDAALADSLMSLASTFHPEHDSELIDLLEQSAAALRARPQAVPEVVAYRIVNHDSGTTVTTDGSLYEAAKAAGMRVDWLAVVGGIPGTLAASTAGEGKV